MCLNILMSLRSEELSKLTPKRGRLRHTLMTGQTCGGRLSSSQTFSSPKSACHCRLHRLWTAVRWLLVRFPCGFTLSRLPKVIVLCPEVSLVLVPNPAPQVLWFRCNTA